MVTVERVFAAVSRVLLYLAAVAMLLMTALVVVASAMRYLVGKPFAFTEELVALLYMTMVFLSIPIATVKRQHISVTLLSERALALLHRPFRLFAAVVMLVFNAWFSVIAFDFTAVSYGLNAKSEQVDILLWPWMALVPLSMGFVSVISLLHLLQATAGVEIEPEQPAGEVL